MDISKTDLRTTIRYLSDAARLYALSDKPKDQNRARLIRNLNNKLKYKLKN